MTTGGANRRCQMTTSNTKTNTKQKTGIDIGTSACSGAPLQRLQIVGVTPHTTFLLAQIATVRTHNAWHTGTCTRGLIMPVGGARLPPTAAQGGCDGTDHMDGDSRVVAPKHTRCAAKKLQTLSSNVGGSVISGGNQWGKRRACAPPSCSHNNICCSQHGHHSCGAINHQPSP